MEHRSKNIGLLLAGGEGLRVHQSRPKQFVEAGGRTVLGHTLDAFAATPDIDLVYTVCAPEWAGLAAEIGRQTCGTRFGGTIDGGQTGICSLRHGIEALGAAGHAADDIIIVHDAVRALVSPEIIADCVRVCREKGNAVAAAESRETFLQTDGGDCAAEIAARSAFRLAQTPVGFALGTLGEIFDEAEARGFFADARGTEDTESLVRLCGALGRFPLHFSAGHWSNFKITEDADLELFRRLCAGRSR